MIMVPPLQHGSVKLLEQSQLSPPPVYESEADFHRLFAHGPRATEELHPFVPNFPLTRKEGETRVVPLMALQVTIFPEFGICIGGWDNGLKSIFLDEWWSLASTWDEDAGPPGHSLEHKVRATFVLSQAQIERLKAWTTDQVSNDSDSTSFRASSFVLTCALIWVCLIKSEESDIKNDNDLLYFIFVADCRNRLSKCPIPDNYFGNCLSICFVRLTRKELTGENGMVEAMKVIGKRIGELEKNGPLEGAEKWMVKWKEVAERWKHVTVAGSPRLGAYDPDFGWGKPKKVEFVQIDRSVAFSVAENGNEEGGVEVGVALTSAQMSCFKSLFERNLKAWSK
uniref:Anthocyanin acyltransferase n=1 Tax=Cannabis sativa TaxID=3483 RepID=A0A803QK58_CANSA